MFPRETYGRRKVSGYTPVSGVTLGKTAHHERTELIIQELAQNVGKVVQGFKQTDLVPDPSFTLQLSDETLSGSNLLAFQKFFDGEFQFDIFYESRSAQKALSGICLLNC